jgi:hypothetical protein
MASKKFRPLGPKIAAKKGGNWKCQLAVEPFFVHIFYKFFPEQRGLLWHFLLLFGRAEDPLLFSLADNIFLKCPTT